jgi:glycosyltransferase involved in cell wall biosynthesis
MPFHPRQLWDYKFVDHMICVSNAVRDKVRSLGWAKDVTVIYNGVEVSLFTPTDRRYEGEANCFYTFGRLVDWKRHDFFVRAAALVRRIDPSAKFLIFGEGKEKSFLEKLIETYHLSSAVRLMGSVEPTDKLLDQCGIFVFTSYEEAFGRVLVEAVLKGKVVVASRSGAVPELLQDHPLLFARDRVDALASQMLRASANFEKYRIEAAEMRVRFAHQFNLDRVAADYLNLYSRMVS